MYKTNMSFLWESRAKTRPATTSLEWCK